MITLDDIAALPPDEGKALAISQWNEIQRLKKVITWYQLSMDILRAALKKEFGNE